MCLTPWRERSKEKDNLRRVPRLAPLWRSAAPRQLCCKKTNGCHTRDAAATVNTRVDQHHFCRSYRDTSIDVTLPTIADTSYPLEQLIVLRCPSMGFQCLWFGLAIVPWWFPISFFDYPDLAHPGHQVDCSRSHRILFLFHLLCWCRQFKLTSLSY